MLLLRLSLWGGSAKIWDLHGLISTSDNIMGPWPNVKQSAITISYSGASWNENWDFVPLNNRYNMKQWEPCVFDSTSALFHNASWTVVWLSSTEGVARGDKQTLS